MQIIHSQHTMVQNIITISKDRKVGMVGEYWAKAIPEHSRADSKSCISTSDVTVLFRLWWHTPVVPIAWEARAGLCMSSMPASWVTGYSALQIFQPFLALLTTTHCSLLGWFQTWSAAPLGTHPMALASPTSRWPRRRQSRFHLHDFMQCPLWATMLG